MLRCDRPLPPTVTAQQSDPVTWSLKKTQPGSLSRGPPPSSSLVTGAGPWACAPGSYLDVPLSCVAPAGQLGVGCRLVPYLGPTYDQASEAGGGGGAGVVRTQSGEKVRAECTQLVLSYCCDCHLPHPDSL